MLLHRFPFFVKSFALCEQQPSTRLIDLKVDERLQLCYFCSFFALFLAAGLAAAFVADFTAVAGLLVAFSAVMDFSAFFTAPLPAGAAVVSAAAVFRAVDLDAAACCASSF